MVSEDAAGIVEDAVVAAQVEGDQRAAGARRALACANCASPLTGPYCAVCGQVNDDYRRPVVTLIAEAVGDLFSVDGRVWRTIPPLIFAPGRMTRLYLRGARARHVRPFRLFLFSSVLFFIVISFLAGDFGDTEVNGSLDLSAAESEAVMAEAQQQLEDIADELPPEADMARQALERAGDELEARAGAEGEDAAPVDPLEAARLEDDQRRAMKCRVRYALLPEEPDPICPLIEERLRALGHETEIETDQLGVDLPLPMRRFAAERVERIIDRPDAYMQAVYAWAPRIIFALAPIYAILLALLHFWRKDIFFFEHIVVSLHFHAFLFLFALGLIALSNIIGVGWAVAMFFFWANAYLYRVHRTVYEDGRVMSVLRVGAMNMMYSVVLTISFLVMLVLGVIST